MTKIKVLVVALIVMLAGVLFAWGQVVPKTKQISHKVYHKGKNITSRTYHKGKHIGRKTYHRGHHIGHKVVHKTKTTMTGEDHPKP